METSLNKWGNGRHSKLAETRNYIKFIEVIVSYRRDNNVQFSEKEIIQITMLHDFRYR